MEKQTTKKCSRCGFYSEYYTKGYCQFYKTGCGWCRKKREIVEKGETCEMFYRSRRVRAQRISVALRSVIDAANALTGLRQIIEEEAEKGGINPTDFYKDSTQVCDE